MVHRVEINGENMLFEATEGPEEIISIDYKEDYGCCRFYINEDGKFRCTARFDIPPQLATTPKGAIAETQIQRISSVILGEMVLKSDQKSYDLYYGDCLRLDVKFSMPHLSSTNCKAKRWEFWLSSRGDRKDYTESCDALLCVGLKEDGGLEVFLIPSTVQEIKTLKKHVSVPVNWENSKYKDYHLFHDRITTLTENQH